MPPRITPGQHRKLLSAGPRAPDLALGLGVVMQCSFGARRLRKLSARECGAVMGDAPHRPLPSPAAAAVPAELMLCRRWSARPPSPPSFHLACTFGTVCSLSWVFYELPSKPFHFLSPPPLFSFQPMDVLPHQLFSSPICIANGSLHPPPSLVHRNLPVCCRVQQNAALLNCNFHRPTWVCGIRWGVGQHRGAGFSTAQRLV